MSYAQVGTHPSGMASFPSKTTVDIVMTTTMGFELSRKCWPSPSDLSEHSAASPKVVDDIMATETYSKLIGGY